MTILEQLKKKEQFTNVEENISKYLLEHQDLVAEMNLTALAKASYASNATIVRLCRKLGFQGYKDFRIAFVAELEKQRRERREVDFDRPFDEKQGTRDVVKNTADLMHEAIDICYGAVSIHELIRAAGWISKARHLYIYGAGDSYISGLSFANQLTKLGIPVIHPMQYNENLAVSITATSADVALVLSYSGYVMAGLTKELQILRRAGCKVILITSSVAHHNVDLTIHFPGLEGDIGKISVYYSQTCFHYILNCLYGLIFAKDFLRNMEMKTEYDHLAQGQRR